jgi:hypothetical protein
VAAVVGLLASLGDPITVALYVTYAGAGWWLIARRPDHSIGWLLLCVAVGFAATTPPGLDPDALVSGQADAMSWFRAWWSTWGGTLVFLGFTGIALTFPSGRLPGGRWRAPVIVALAIALAATALVALRPTFDLAIEGGSDIIVPNRLAIAPSASFWTVVDALDDLIYFYLLALLATAIVGLLLRYRRSEGIVRLQLRWLVAALAAMVTSVVVALVVAIVFGDVVGAWIPAGITYLLVPVSIAVAISRYRLFEIDRIISRTIGWASVSGLLVAAFATLVIGLQALLVNVTQGQTLAVAASTLVAFALFQPVRRIVQQAVDRRFDRARYDAQRTAEAFAERLRTVVDLDTVAEDLNGAVEVALRPRSVGLWLKAPDR